MMAIQMPSDPLSNSIPDASHLQRNGYGQRKGLFLTDAELMPPPKLISPDFASVPPTRTRGGHRHRRSLAISQTSPNIFHSPPSPSASMPPLSPTAFSSSHTASCEILRSKETEKLFVPSSPRFEGKRVSFKEVQLPARPPSPKKFPSTTSRHRSTLSLPEAFPQISLDHPLLVELEEREETQLPKQAPGSPSKARFFGITDRLGRHSSWKVMLRDFRQWKAKRRDKDEPKSKEDS